MAGGFTGGSTGSSGYGDFFSYNKTPEAKTEYRTRTVSTPGGPFKSVHQRQTVGGGSVGGWSGVSSGSDFFADMMTGYDAKTKELTGKLRSMYDNLDTSGYDDILNSSGGYDAAIAEYKEKMAPLMESLNNDIGALQDWSTNYQDTVKGMESRFNGIDIEQGPGARREEYMGNVASQYGAAEKDMNAQMASQGINPYANSGASRQLKLDRAGAMAGASNKAYSDWRGQYNQDVMADQNAAATYAGLQKGTGDAIGSIMSARHGLGDMQSGIHNAEIGALQNNQNAKLTAQGGKLNAQLAQTGGYEGLAGLNESRRTQALTLEQAKQAQNAQIGLAKSQMSAGLSGEWRSPAPGWVMD